MASDLKTLLPNSVSRSLKQTYLWLRGLFYTGSNYHCNICNRSFRKMLPGGFDLDVINEKQIVGAGLRSHICPYCQSTDRDRLVKLYLDKSFDLKNDKFSILHIAPEPALFQKLSKYKNLVYHPAVKYHEGIYYPTDIDLVDITDLYFEDSKFDIIICNHVLEHIENDELALKELFRVLRPNGTAILQVPYSKILSETYENKDMTTSKQREEHFGQFDHVRLYGTNYSSHLEQAGFKLRLFNPEESYEKQEIIKLALFKGEKLFVVEKP